jgi:putative transposase
MAVARLMAKVGTGAACGALDVPRASYYRWRWPIYGPRRPRPSPPRALSDRERQDVTALMHSERFIDCAPRAIYAQLLEEERYLCSFRTMYRILEALGESRERRDQRVHPEYVRPELLAVQPNEVWSWDITKLRGPVKWTYFYLYVLLDIFSRYVVGWTVAEYENARLAKRLIEDTCAKQNILPGQLIVHQDRGAPMTSKTLSQLYADMAVGPSFSRPRVSNDNPYSEAHFRTLKYRPGYPKRFGSIQDARAFCRRLIHWYNTQHHHSGIAYLTPEVVHYGRAETVLAHRQAALDEAYRAHPERFVKGRPCVAPLPRAAWINPPAAEQTPEVFTPGPLLSAGPNPAATAGILTN